MDIFSITNIISTLEEWYNINGVELYHVVELLLPVVAITVFFMESTIMKIVNYLRNLRSRVTSVEEANAGLVARVEALEAKSAQTDLFQAPAPVNLDESNALLAEDGF